VFFEVTIVTCVVIHALASPRSAQVPLARALQRDGIFFFFSVVLLRVANMSIAVSVRTSLKLVAILCVLLPIAPPIFLSTFYSALSGRLKRRFSIVLFYVSEKRS
jgi:hypothetical protein